MRFVCDDDEFILEQNRLGKRYFGLVRNLPVVVKLLLRAIRLCRQHRRAICIANIAARHALNDLVTRHTVKFLVEKIEYGRPATIDGVR